MPSSGAYEQFFSSEVLRNFGEKGFREGALHELVADCVLNAPFHAFFPPKQFLCFSALFCVFFGPSKGSVPGFFFFPAHAFFVKTALF